ncbi:hypothetical protein ADUPG1_009637 [Aduncisulcus paluster]|uniref:non-specific serine/threonine protein kinase n=1 Tax=Aduncisulcus paluster TaxID=2918883 RepID=A0ABQ5L064_9EUKA|nr:hypothetical protein ADUPG1_009637 [Aduncisulcus paluster]
MKKFLAPMYESLILNSASKIIPLCSIGSGGFGEVFLIKLKLSEIKPRYCVLKSMHIDGVKSILQNCTKEFVFQFELFLNPICTSRIPRPLYILDANIKGFLMDYCRGGSVKDFARSWCIGGKYGVPSHSMDLNPVRVSSLCIGMIECLDDVFKANSKLIHRDIKPDNFLVQFKPDSKSEKCSILLADLGLSEIRNSISSSFLAGSSPDSKPHQKRKAACKKSIIGTLVYNSYEALEGRQSQKSDAYSLGMSIQALFEGINPLLNMPCLQFLEPCEYVKELKEVISNGTAPKLSGSCLFQSLMTIDGGKYKAVYSCLNEVFEGLTKLKIDERMSVSDARTKVQDIKGLLPKIGKEWECPSIDDFIANKLEEHGEPRSLQIKCCASSTDDIDKVKSIHDQPWAEGVSQIPKLISSHSRGESESDESEKTIEEEDIKEDQEIMRLKQEKRKKKRQTMDRQHSLSSERSITDSSSSTKEELDRDKVNLASRQCYGLQDKIEACQSEEAKSSLYHEHRDDLVIIIDAWLSSNWDLLFPNVLSCCTCLSLFVHSKNDLYLPIPDLKDLITTFIGYLSRIEQTERTKISEIYCRICVDYTFKVHDDLDDFFGKISSTFEHILCLKTGELTPKNVKIIFDCLVTLKTISFSPFSSTNMSIFTLIKSYITDWFKIESSLFRLESDMKYDQSKFYGEIMIILANITRIDQIPDIEVCSRAWDLFSPVFELVEGSFVGENIKKDNHYWVLRFFANLCCERSHAITIYSEIEGRIYDWYKLGTDKQFFEGINFWMELISWLSIVRDPPLFPPSKYDKHMERCLRNGGSFTSYSRYFGHTMPNLKQWYMLIELLIKCPNATEKQKLYEKKRGDIHAEFVTYGSKIKKHRHLIIICCICLQLFVKTIYADKEVFLPIESFRDLVKTFFPHISHAESVLEDVIHKIFCTICVNYTLLVEEQRYLLLSEIKGTLSRLLKRSKSRLETKLKGDIPFLVSTILYNFSNCRKDPTMKTLLDLIKPYVGYWLKAFPDSKISGKWMVILKNITWSSPTNAPNQTHCKIAFQFFPQVLSFVRELKRDQFSENDNEYFLFFAANLCCIPSNALRIYDNIKDYLEGWFDSLKRKEKGIGLPIWCKLISMLSSNPALIEKLSPRFDNQMEWCKTHVDLASLSLDEEHSKYLWTSYERKGTVFDEDYDRYCRNCKCLP